MQIKTRRSFILEFEKIDRFLNSQTEITGFDPECLK